MEILNVKLVGTTPILMHNARLADPSNPYTIAIKEVTSKKKKTDEDHRMVQMLEWLGGLYLDKDVLPSEAEKATANPILPEANLLSFINDGARHFRKGQDVLRGMIITSGPASLITKDWSDKKTLHQLYATGKFKHVCSVVITNRVMRCRPIFRDWSATFDVGFDPELLNRKDVVQFIERAGRYNGLGDYRPMHGRCSAEIT